VPRSIAAIPKQTVNPHDDLVRGAIASDIRSDARPGGTAVPKRTAAKPAEVPLPAQLSESSTLTDSVGSSSDAFMQGLVQFAAREGGAAEHALTDLVPRR
jgi:hypothetical protein